MKKTLIALTAMLMLCGCYKDGERLSPAKTNSHFDVHFLFEVDGVKVYRFEDGGHYVYFTNANGRCEYEHYVSTGKFTYTEKMQTVCSNTEQNER